MVLVRSAQDLCDRVAGVFGVFQTPKDIAHPPSSLIRPLGIPWSPAQVEHALREGPSMFSALGASTLGVSSLPVTPRVCMACVPALGFPWSEGRGAWQRRLQGCSLLRGDQ